MCSIDRNEKNDFTGDFIANIIRLTANKIVFCVKKVCMRMKARGD